MPGLYDLYVKVGIDDDGYKSGLNTVKASTIAAGQIMAQMAMKAAGAIVDLGKQAFDSYSNYEQLVGGIETLFGAGGDSLTEYAERTGKTVAECTEKYNSLIEAQNLVMENAKAAYETAGMDANTYMQTVTSFSASLLQGLDGDTKRAAEVSNQAIIDMSDNANKMGTEMGSIMNAYQGFAKQNYTMLDNLKIGYGGTKTEMERLLTDAEKLKAEQGEIVDYSIDNFADVIEAIHVIQDDIGITGTTAKEAATTIEGSLKMMSAAWANLITGLGDPEADISALVEQLVTSIGTFASNAIPTIEQIMDGAGQAVKSFVDELNNVDISAVAEHLSSVVGSTADLIVSLAEGVAGALSVVLKSAPEIITALADAISTNAGSIGVAAVDLMGSLANAVIEAIPVLADAAPQIVDGLVSGICDGFSQADFSGVAPQIYNGLNDAISSVNELPLSIIAGFMNGIADSVGDEKTFYGFFGTAKDALEDVEEQFENGGTISGEMFHDALNGVDLSDAGLRVKQSFLDALASGDFESANEIFMNFLAYVGEGFRDAGVQLVTELSDGITSAVDSATESVGEVVENIQEFIDSAVETVSEKGSELITNLADGISSAASSALSAIQSICDRVLQAVQTKASNMLTAGRNLVSSVASGISGGVSSVISAAANVGAQIVARISGFVSQMLTAGRSLISNLASGVRTGVSNVVSAIASLGTRMVAKVRSFFGQMSQAGSYILQGFVQGLRSKLQEALGVAQNLGSQILGTLRGIFAFGSPSKVMIQYGKWIVEGLAIGMSKSEIAVKQAWALANQIANEITGRIKFFNERIAEIEAAQTARSDEKEKKNYEKKLADYQEKLAEAQKKGETEKITEYQEAISDLQDDWNEKMLKKQEDAEKEFLQSAASTLYSLYDEFEDALEDIEKSQDKLSDKMKSYGSLFTYIKKKSGEYMDISGIDDDIKAIEKYGEALENIQERGINDALMSEILDMGIDDATTYINKLLKMNDDAYAEYIEKYEKKQSLSEQIATRFYADDVTSLTTNYENAVLDVLDSIRDGAYDVGKELGDELYEGISESALNVKGVGKYLQAILGSSIELVSSQDGVANRVLASAATLVNNGNSDLTANVILDGEVIASAVFEPLKKVARQKGVALA